MATFLTTQQVLQALQGTLHDVLQHILREKLFPNVDPNDAIKLQDNVWGLGLLLKRFCAGLHFDVVCNRVNFDMFKYITILSAPFGAEVYDYVESLDIPFSFANMQSKIYERQFAAIGTPDLNSSNLVELSFSQTYKIVLNVDLTEQIQKMQEYYEGFK